MELKTTEESAYLMDFERRLDDLRMKVALQKSLSEAIAAEFDSLTREFEPLRQKFDVTTEKFESTSNNFEPISIKSDPTTPNFDSLLKKFEPTRNNFDSTSPKSDPKTVNFDSSSGNFDSTNSKNDSLTDITAVAESIRKSAAAQKIYFEQPNIPVRMARIVSGLREKKTLTVPEMMTLTDASRSSIIRHISILKKLGFIQFRGGRRNGSFLLTEKGARLLERAPAS